MIVSRSLRALPPRPEGGSVVSIGVFDGVHLGHRAILEANVARARELGASATVVTFSGHPKRVLLGRAPRTLTHLRHRMELFRQAGIEHTLVLEFDDELRRTPAKDFVDRILITGLGAVQFVLGFDSKFGRNREGTPERLRELGYPVEIPPKVVVDGRAVSSTVIRESIELGDLEGAEEMLGRPVTVLGKVVHGDGIGRELGFPTANLDLAHQLHPPPGVYASRVRLIDELHFDRPPEEPTRTLAAVTNIGFRPTLAGERPAEPRVEVHVLDFVGDLYGGYLELEFVQHLREERRFESPEQLVHQIRADVRGARSLLRPASGD